MKAKKKTIDVMDAAETGIDVAPRLATLKVVDPPRRQAGVRVASAAELVEKLHTEAKVI